MLRWLWVALALASPPIVEAGDGVVRALLFVSPTCPHCHKVLEEVLPPLSKGFEGRLQIGVVSTATPTGQNLYWAAHRRFAVRMRGVPLLVVGDIALVGSEEIPRRLPGLVEGYLAEGGVGWPDIPGLAELVAASAAPTPPPPADTALEAARAEPPIPSGAERELSAPTASPAAAPAASPAADASTRPAPVTATAPPPRETAASPTPATAGSLHASAPVASAAGVPQSPAHSQLAPLSFTAAPGGVAARVLADPHGNGLALLVLAGMAVCVLRSVAVLRRPAFSMAAKPLDWLCPLLALVGLGVAAYLARVEVGGIEAVCGPVGDCNTVQQSEYARLFGVLPIGVLGVAGFAAILVAWATRRWTTGRSAGWAAITLLALTGLGTLFSMYLTFLEPFVIGATCLWCLSSAVIMTTLYGLALEPGRAAAAALRQRDAPGGPRRTTW